MSYCTVNIVWRSITNQNHTISACYLSTVISDQYSIRLADHVIKSSCSFFVIVTYTRYVYNAQWRAWRGMARANDNDGQKQLAHVAHTCSTYSTPHVVPRVRRRTDHGATSSACAKPQGEKKAATRCGVVGHCWLRSGQRSIAGPTPGW